MAKNTTLFIFFVLLIGLLLIIYEDFMGSKFEIDITTVDLDTLENADVDAETVGIPTILSEWRQRFRHLILHNQSIDSQPHQRSNLISLLSRSYKALRLSHRDTTSLALLTASHPYSFHELNALRRQMMIIYQRLLSHSAEDDAHVQSLYRSIIDEFIAISAHLYQRRAMQQMTWFHIHISKAGGTTLRETFKRLGRPRRHLENGKHENRLLQGSTFRSCATQYQMTEHLPYTRREAPMMTANDYFDVHRNESNFDGPSLCNRFIYVLPVREPLERICSQIAQFNKRKRVVGAANHWRRLDAWQLNRDAFGDLDAHMDSEIDAAVTQPIVINGVPYRLITQGVDYRGYFVALLDAASKSKSDSGLQALSPSFKDVHARLWAESYLTDEINASIPDVFQAGGIARLIPLDARGKLEESEFLISVNKPMVDLEWHRTKSGSNVYCSWLGYNYTKLKGADAYIEMANHVDRSAINESHLHNAVELMMKVEYVLPFETASHKAEDGMDAAHAIWRIALRHIHEYFGDESELEWAHSNESGGLKIKSSEICNALAPRDRAVLLEYNQLDLRFYDIAKMVEQVDVLFFQALASARM